MKGTFIPVIYDCNDNCISCPVPRRLSRENPSLDNLKKDIDEILSRSNHIEINGGEPTLRKDLIQILRYIEAKEAKEISLLSNVRLFSYEEYVKRIADIKNLRIITTLYGHNPEVQESITRAEGSFNQKIKGLRNLIKYNLQIEVRILLHKMNYLFFCEIAQFLIDNFAGGDFRIVIMNPKLTLAAFKNKEVVAEKLSIISKVLEKPVNKLIYNGFQVKLYHYPHCILPESIRKYSMGFTSTEIDVGFLKECGECSMKDNCSGIWKSYLAVLGNDEFKPIRPIIICFNKKDAAARFKLIPEEDDFLLDKLYFLLGLKDVVRIEKKDKTFEEAIIGLGGLDHASDDSYIFVSFDKEKAKLVKKLTRMAKDKSLQISEQEKQKIESKLGELYGYPKCCSENFHKINPQDEIKEKIRSERTSFTYKNKTLYLLHYPCSEDCKNTQELKSEIKSRLEHIGIK